MSPFCIRFFLRMRFDAVVISISRASGEVNGIYSWPPIVCEIRPLYTQENQKRHTKSLEFKGFVIKS